MKNELRVTTQGIRGGKNKHESKGYAMLSIRSNREVSSEDCSITVDMFTGSGKTYQEREKALINISFPGGATWSGTAEDLKQKLCKI